MTLYSIGLNVSFMLHIRRWIYKWVSMPLLLQLAKEQHHTVLHGEHIHAKCTIHTCNVQNVKFSFSWNLASKVSISSVIGHIRSWNWIPLAVYWFNFLPRINKLTFISGIVLKSCQFHDLCVQLTMNLVLLLFSFSQTLLGLLAFSPQQEFFSLSLFDSTGVYSSAEICTINLWIN